MSYQTTLNVFATATKNPVQKLSQPDNIFSLEIAQEK